MSDELTQIGAPQPGETVTLTPGEYHEHGVPGEDAVRFTVAAVSPVYAQNGARYVDAKGYRMHLDGAAEPIPRYLSIHLGPL